MSKFGNKKAMCLLRHIHDSKFEAGYCNRLLAMKQKGEIFDFKIQHPFDLMVNGELICRHFVDFLVHTGLKGVETEVHETKGVKTDAWSIKHKLFKVLYPGIKYLIIQKAQRRKSWAVRTYKGSQIIPKGSSLRTSLTAARMRKGMF